MVLNVVRRGSIPQEVWQSSTIDETISDIISRLTITDSVESILVICQEGDSVPLMITLSNKTTMGVYYGVTVSIRSICDTRHKIRTKFRVFTKSILGGKLDKKIKIGGEIMNT